MKVKLPRLSFDIIKSIRNNFPCSVPTAKQPLNSRKTLRRQAS